MLATLHSQVSGLTGWRRNAAAFAGGVLMTLTLPPVFLLPLLIPAFTLLYWLADSAPTTRRAFADGWWWGLGWHMTGLYWFCIALLTEPEKFAWLIPFCFFGLNAIIALYAGVASAAWKKTGCHGLAGVFMFALVWTLVEFARGHLFTGFPWNLAGYSFTVSDALLQPASLVGIYGLTWLATFLGALPALLTDDRTETKKAVRVNGAAYAVLALLFAWGGWRLAATGDVPSVPDVRLRLVQANIQQHHKWDEKLRARGMQAHVELTGSPGSANLTYVIWPETAVPYAFRDETPDGRMSLQQLLGMTLPPRVALITGALRIEGDDGRMYNSIVALNRRGDMAAHYDKVRLVPFGEFLPFRALLPDTWLTPAGAKDFSTGPAPQTIRWPDLPPVAPLICYEAIYPRFIAGAQERPQWMLNLTNDAWFGHSSGPYQHFHMARTRSVEEGLPLVRVANTGITAVVDGYGRIKAEMGLGEKGILDVALPVPNKDRTFYSRAGEWLIAWLTFLGMMLIIRQRRRKNN